MCAGVRVVCTCIKIFKEVPQTSVFLREGESWRAASKYKKLAFHCFWLQLKQSKSVFDGKPKIRQKMSYYLSVFVCHTAQANTLHVQETHQCLLQNRITKDVTASWNIHWQYFFQMRNCEIYFRFVFDANFKQYEDTSPQKASSFNQTSQTTCCHTCSR